MANHVDIDAQPLEKWVPRNPTYLFDYVDHLLDTGLSANLYIPDRVTIITNNVRGMSHNKSLSLGESVPRVFDSVRLPGSLEVIEGFTLLMVTSKRIDLPKRTKVIGDRAFEWSLVESINLEHVEHLGTRAFWCSQIQTADLSSLAVVSDSAFMGSDLYDVKFSSKLKEISNCAFLATKLKNVVFPDSLVRIGRSVFLRSLLERASIGENVEYVDRDAFACEYLKHVDIRSKNARISHLAFDRHYYRTTVRPAIHCRSNKVAKMIDGKENIIELTCEEEDVGYSEGRCENLSILNLPNAKLIRPSAFEDTAIRYVTLSPHIDCITDYAFSNCRMLISIGVPETLRIIGKGSFENTGLIEIEFPEALWSIGPMCFQTCTALSEVRINSLIDCIPDACFMRSGLKSVTIPRNVRSIGHYSFANCSELKTVVCDHNIVMGQRAFLKCQLDNLPKLES